MAYYAQHAQTHSQSAAAAIAQVSYSASRRKFTLSRSAHHAVRPLLPRDTLPPAYTDAEHYLGERLGPET